MSSLLSFSAAAMAAGPALDVSQYAHKAWKVRDGFVDGVISSLAQTSDGYLWLGTEFGLVRFDGEERSEWQPPRGQALPSNRIYSLLGARDGTLWIGTSRGLASWKDGKLSRYAQLDGLTVRAAMVEDHEGTVWAGGQSSSANGKLCSFRANAVQCYGDDGSLVSGVSGLYEDRSHRLWVGVRNGLWQWLPGPPKFYPAQAPAANNGGIQGLAESEDGSLLFGSQNGIGRLAGGEIGDSALAGASPLTALRLLRHADGSLWVGTADAGLVHIRPGRIDRFSQGDGLSGDFITALLVDREGSIWVATAGGLDRFREAAVSTLSLNQGLLNASVLSVLADRDGSVWLSTRRGLNRWKDGEITIFGDGPPSARPGLLNGDYAGSMFQDSRGRVWASTLREFGYLENGRFIPVKSVPGGAVYAIAEDAAGSLWIANREQGLMHLARDGAVERTSWAELGRHDPAMALAPDPGGNGVWIGFNQGGVLYFAGGRVQRLFAPVDGLGPGRVNDLHFDPGGALWAATEGGLSRLKDGRAVTLNAAKGLPCDGVHCMMTGDDGAVWLYTACGLVRLARSELDAWAVAAENGKDAPVRPTLFNSSDGVRSQEETGGYTPHGVRSADGRLWFLPSDGASVLNPRHIPFNSTIPPVHIQRITANRQTHELDGSKSEIVRLPALIRDLEIDYTALSLAVPEKVHFRYKLEGRDPEWQDVGTRRQAFYTDLGPRTYRFRVIACNNSGVWNEAGSFVDFNIAPAFYQTTLFRLSCVTAFLVALWALYRARLKRMAAQFNIRLEERVNERTRIARELHDTLLQSFQAVLLKFAAFSFRLADHPEVQKQLDTIVAQAREAVTEGRDAVQGLRASTIVANEMAQAIRAFGEELTAAPAPESHQSARFDVVVEGSSRDLVPLVRDEVYRIACEAVRNAYRHGQSERIEAAIVYGDRHFRLRIADNGIGIDPGILSAGRRPGHHGLPGMKERAHLAGGELIIRSKPGSGTEIELKIPASIAYQAPGAAAKRRPADTHSA